MADDVIPNFPTKDIQYFKIPHHGSKYGLTPDYLNLFKPELAVISVGAKNRYGHPTQEVLKLLEGKGIKLYRTDLDGDIVVETDGEDWKIDK